MINTTATQTTEQTTETKTTYVVEVLKARVIKATETEQVISFDIKANGVTIYGMIYRAGTSANTGNDYEAVSFPARKGTGNDNKYYNYAWFPISKEMRAEIIEQLAKILSK